MNTTEAHRVDREMCIVLAESSLPAPVLVGGVLRRGASRVMSSKRWSLQEG